MKNLDLKRPSVPEITPLVQDYINQPGNHLGGNLHIVLEDGNVDDDSLEFCLRRCIERDDKLGINLARILLMMSMTQRLKLAKSFHYPF